MVRGNILYGLGALVVIVCFFLPWVAMTHAQAVDEVYDAALPQVLSQMIQQGTVPAGTTVDALKGILEKIGLTEEAIVTQAMAALPLSEAAKADFASGKSWTGLQIATKGQEFMGTKVQDPDALLWIVLGAAVVGLIVAGLASTRALPRRFGGFLAILIGLGILAVLFFAPSLADGSWQELKQLPAHALYGMWATIAGAGADILGGLIDLF